MAKPGRDWQTQARFQPPRHQAHFQPTNPSSFPKSTENKGNLWRTEGEHKEEKEKKWKREKEIGQNERERKN